MIKIRSPVVILTLISLLVLAGCSSTSRRSGGYYKDDGPGTSLPSNLDSIPDAVPRIETRGSGTARPYVIFGKRYVPIGQRPFRQEGTASWYGKKFHGEKTANGETYDMYAMTAAHPILPIPSYAKVTRVATGKSVIVRINDRGPFHSSRIIDLSYVAAAKLGILGPGSDKVIVQAITDNDIRQAAAGKSPPIAARPAPVPAPVAAAPVAAAPAPAVPAATVPAGPRAASPPTPDALAAMRDTDAGTDRPAQIRTEPADTAPQPAVTQNDGQIYLQFGAFSGEENARHLAQQMNRQIGQIESRPARVQSAGDVHRVQIGPYPNRTAAVNAALRIQEQTGVQPTVAVR